MTSNAATEFMNRWETDDALAARIPLPDTFTTRDEALAALVKIAADVGLAMTTAELHAALSAPGDALRDEQLDEVAGGFGSWHTGSAQAWRTAIGTPGCLDGPE